MCLFCVVVAFDTILVRNLLLSIRFDCRTRRNDWQVLFLRRVLPIPNNNDDADDDDDDADDDDDGFVFSFFHPNREWNDDFIWVEIAIGNCSKICQSARGQIWVWERNKESHGQCDQIWRKFATLAKN